LPETGEARFDNNTNEIRKGNGNHTLRIKGVTESSAANKMKIIATPVNSSTELNSKEFTVAVISSLVFQRINTTPPNEDVPFDENPGTDGIPNTDMSEGQRVFPDKNTPADGTDRSVIRVRANISPAMPNAKVYFASFDLDDPSANAAPIDSNGSDGNDNNGAINQSKSGELMNSTSGTCVMPSIANDVSKIECTAGTGKGAVTNYRLTMQPGDNYAVAATLTPSYRDGPAGGVGIRVNPSNGANLINASNQIIPISAEANPNNVQGIRTRMLTVWRKVHIEVDRMGSVPARTSTNANNVAGTIAQTMTIPANNGIRNVNVTTTPLLEVNRFGLGRIEYNGYSLIVNSNTANSLEIINPNRRNLTLTQGSDFILFDDDDYNFDDTVINDMGQITRFDVDGDDNEAIRELNNVFTYLQDADGIGQNILTSAYIRPEYNWAIPYNQTNLTFDLNVESNNTPTDELTTALNTNRNSRNDERSDFWIAYFLLGYQGNANEDADGDAAVPGISRQIGGTLPCDCYRDPNLPNQPITCPLLTPAPITCTQLPTGSFGSLLYQEIQQDVERSWLIAGNVVQSIQTTAPHELGHQFGLSGDVRRTTFGIMDYSALPTMNSVTLHPEHINIIRRRANSPGQ